MKERTIRRLLYHSLTTMASAFAFAQTIQKDIPVRFTARTVLVDENNEVLLLKYRDNDEFFWLTPGGGVEAGETLEQAAQRELYEETGIKNATYSTEHRWYAEQIVLTDGKSVKFCEHFFLARAVKQQSLSTHLSEREARDMLEAQGWGIEEFIAAGECFYPYGLLYSLRTLFCGKLPPSREVHVIEEIYPPSH